MLQNINHLTALLENISNFPYFTYFTKHSLYYLQAVKDQRL